MLLKITHLPYVAAILAYESASRYMSQDGDSWRSESPKPSQRKSLLASRLSSSRKPLLPALRSRSEASLIKTPTAADVRPSPAGSNDLYDLKQMILKLNAQVEELTLRLDRQ
ncbi:MAG: hypothetical protein Q9187_003021, partial [Circinaria calcarea]